VALRTYLKPNLMARLYWSTSCASYHEATELTLRIEDLTWLHRSRQDNGCYYMRSDNPLESKTSCPCRIHQGTSET
jgi:hypothetical protein